MPEVEYVPVLGYANELVPNNAELIYFKICDFRYISTEEESKLSAVNKETYDSIFLLLDTNLLGAVELFIPGHDAKCIVHADYEAPFFTPVDDVIYFTCLFNVSGRVAKNLSNVQIPTLRNALIALDL